MMTATARYDDMNDGYDDHQSLSASLEDFEEQRNRSPLFGLPSQHSGFKSDVEESEPEVESSNGEPWSPPGLQRRNTGGGGGIGWYRHQPYNSIDRIRLRPSLSPSRSRETSPQYEDAVEGDEDITIPANIPLPKSTDSPMKGRSPSPAPAGDGFNNEFHDAETVSENTNNYIRFAVRAEVQHREPFVAFFSYLRNKLDAMTKTRTSTATTVILTTLSLFLFRIVFVAPTPLPVPDLVKLSTLARSFEPLIFYSENGVTQVSALQETGVAVWDLGESVRSTNMTSAPLIVNSLDDLSESLKTLSLELTKFFANVDADVDSILIVMDWAQRELADLSIQNGRAMTGLVFDNIHGFLCQTGLLESNGQTTTLGRLVVDIFGASHPQRTRQTLTRTFNEFLNVLEESINSELTHSTALFALFESIDRQFLNLQRSVVRESDAQERLESDLLSSLWTRVLGSNASMLRKYEKNKQLLASVRSRTVSNKQLIVDHHGKLQTLKVNLETLRRKLVSPLVRRNDAMQRQGVNGGSGIVEEQIRGLEGTYEYLKMVREKQKSKLMEMIYRAGMRGTRMVVGGSEGIGIEGR